MRRRSNSGGSLRIVSGLAENTNSIFGDGSSELEAANGCVVLLQSRNQRPRGHRCAKAHPDSINARSPERATDTCAFLLTLTYIEVANWEITPVLPFWGYFSMGGFSAKCRDTDRLEQFNERFGLVASIQDHAGLAQPTSWSKLSL